MCLDDTQAPNAKCGSDASRATQTRTTEAKDGETSQQIYPIMNSRSNQRKHPTLPTGPANFHLPRVPTDAVGSWTVPAGAIWSNVEADGRGLAVPSQFPRHESLVNGDASIQQDGRNAHMEHTQAGTLPGRGVEENRPEVGDSPTERTELNRNGWRIPGPVDPIGGHESHPHSPLSPCREVKPC